MLDRLGVSTIPHIEKTRSLGVDVATTQSHLRAMIAILGYLSRLDLHHSKGFTSPCRQF